MTTLPPGWSVRPPTLDDVRAILAVVHASDIAEVGEADFTADEVVEMLTAPNHDMRLDSWVALDGSGQVVGWAYIHNPQGGPRENFDVYVHPEHGRVAQPVLFELVLARIAQRAHDAGLASLVARGGAIASEREYVALLRSAGFAFVKRYARMSRPLAPVEPAPDPPVGFVVRPVRPDDDADLRAFHEVFESAFQDTADHQPSSYEEYRGRIAALPRIDWDEWFVVESGGRTVATLQSSSSQDDEGWVRYLAVHKEFRGRGLGGLLLRTAFRAYAAKGYRSAGLAVDTENPTGAYRLYESVGMHPAYEADMYERTVPSA